VRPVRSSGRVLDASALLAWLGEEPGAEVVERSLEGSAVSAVNLSEVLQKGMVAGAEAPGVAGDLSDLGVSVAVFGAEEAALAAELWGPTRGLGLGIADRACMATAVALGLPALTADREWRGVEFEGLAVEVIR